MNKSRERPYHSPSYYLLMGFTIPLHPAVGFIFNNAYSLPRFTVNAGSASRLTGGGVYVVSFAVDYSLIHLLGYNIPIDFPAATPLN